MMVWALLGRREDGTKEAKRQIAAMEYAVMEDAGLEGLVSWPWAEEQKIL